MHVSLDIVEPQCSQSRVLLLQPKLPYNPKYRLVQLAIWKSANISGIKSEPNLDARRRSRLQRRCFSAWKLSRPATRTFGMVDAWYWSDVGPLLAGVLLVHGPTVCRLTCDRQQLINAFMSIRLAVHHRFKPRPVQPNPPIHPTDQPTTHPATQRGRHASPTPPSLSLFSTHVCMSHALRAATRNLRYHRDASIQLNDRTITPIEVMY